MACKVEKQGTLISNEQIKSFSIDEGLTEFYKNPILNVANINLIQNKIKDFSISIPYKNVTLPKSTIPNTSINNAYAIGKNLLMIDKNSYGPSLRQRNSGNEILVDTQSNTDPFRLLSAKYWTLSDDEKEIIYLNEQGAKHKISNYNFVQGVINLSDIQFKNSLRSIVNDYYINVFSPMDKLLNRFTQQTRNQEEQTIFSTQQWIMITPEKINFLVNTNKTNTISNSKKTSEIDNIYESIKKVYSGIDYISNVAKKTTINVEYSSNLWKLYINGGISQDGKVYPPLIVVKKDYYDYSFIVPVPFLKKDIENKSLLSNPLIYDVGFEYVFFMREYEEKIKTASEKLLPNFYILEEEMTKKVSNSEYQKLITLNNLVDIKEAIIVPPSKVIDYTKINQKYFNGLANQYAIINQKSLSDALAKKSLENMKKMEDLQTNIGIPLDNVEILNKYYDYRVMFPMYIDLQFSTDKITAVAEILKDCRLDKLLMKDIISGNNNIYTKRTFIEENEIVSQEKNNLGSISLNKSFSISNNDRKVWDITNWLLNVHEKEIEIKNGLLLFKEDDVGEENNNEIVKNLLRIISVGKIKKLVKDKFRTYEEMINGKLAYSETVMYKIEKSLSDEKGNKVGDPIQNYYVSNSNEIDILKIIDTQVKYNTRYRYDVYAYQMVIGTKYRYEDKVISDEAATFSVIQVPSIILVEVPYFTFSDIMIDCPPVRPDVKIVPYKGVNNKLLFLFNGNVGDYVEIPIIVDVEDRMRIEEYRKTKKIGYSDFIRFKSDDHVSQFQLYKTDIEPKNYSDFSGKLIALVQTNTSPLVAEYVTSAAYIDTIIPNKKYWYCFRAIDNHGHLSQPTEIFQVQMVDDHGMVYPIVEVFDMGKNKNDVFVAKPMRKYLYIGPTLLQKILDEAGSGILNVDSSNDLDPRRMKLGVQDSTVWGNKYKIRITSKKTGKKVDLNIRCSYDGIRKEKGML